MLVRSSTHDNDREMVTLLTPCVLPCRRVVTRLDWCVDRTEVLESRFGEVVWFAEGRRVILGRVYKGGTPSERVREGEEIGVPKASQQK